MPQTNPIDEIKDCERQAKKIVEEARAQSRENLSQALKAKEAAGERALEQERQRAAQAVKAAAETAEAGIEAKKKEIRAKAEGIVTAAGRQREKAAGLIIDRLKK
jgi:vacuolar-type H+-ATPase subunit H